MPSKEQNLYKMMMKRFEIFKLQDPKTGGFDVIFEVEEKLYAYSLLLTSVSTTFASMFSKNWRKNPDDPIEIATYRFDDFKEFITFIYSGECKFAKENVLPLLDMAEYFGVETFKEACDLHLCHEIKVKDENVFEMLELSLKYSLTHLKEAANSIIKYKFREIIENDKFLTVDKSIVKEILDITKNRSNDEKVFKAVYLWVEKQARAKHLTKKDSTLNDLIKAELSDFMQLFNFEEMEKRFIRDFVAPKSFLFDAVRLNDMIFEAQNTYTVELTDAYGNILKGELYGPIADNVYAAIKSLDEDELIASKIYINETNPEDEHCMDDMDYYFYWPTNSHLPSFPSNVKEMDISGDGFHFDKGNKQHGYLVFDEEGDITLKRPCELFYGDYLLAEMFRTSDVCFFRLSDKCKIRIYPTL